MRRPWALKAPTRGREPRSHTRVRAVCTLGKDQRRPYALTSGSPWGSAPTGGEGEGCLRMTSRQIETIDKDTEIILKKKSLQLKSTITVIHWKG